VVPLIPIDEYTLHLDKLIPAIMDFYDIPGSSIALVREGKLAWSEAYGIADVQTGRKLSSGLAGKDSPGTVNNFTHISLGARQAGRIDCRSFKAVVVPVGLVGNAVSPPGYN
jgi:hypothetical protein